MPASLRAFALLFKCNRASSSELWSDVYHLHRRSSLAELKLHRVGPDDCGPDVIAFIQTCPMRIEYFQLPNRSALLQE